MKTFKNRFNQKVRYKREPDLFLLWQMLFILMEQQLRLERELARVASRLRGNRPWP